MFDSGSLAPSLVNHLALVPLEPCAIPVTSTLLVCLTAGTMASGVRNGHLLHKGIIHVPQVLGLQKCLLC